jgi:FkbM family methyltransferase
MIKCKINQEFEIFLPEHRARRPEWYVETGWEKKRLQSIHKHLKEGDVMFYVGAEEGDMPALCQMWGAEVVLFEPNDKVWPNIKAIWTANNLHPPLGSFEGFASNQSTGSVFIKNGFPDCADGELISDHAFKELISPGDIPQIRIDDFVEQSGIIPTALSLDVEGSEWEVLKGAEETLNKHHPKIWLSAHPEFMFRMFNAYTYDLRNWIMNQGYEETLLDYQHEAHFFYEANLY